MRARFVRAALAAFAVATGASGAGAASPPDSLEQRLAACTACHDTSGRRGRDAYYPRIAGKPAGYLYNQLQHFREGRRFYGLMTYLVDHLPEPYLREIAEHFANQQPPYPAPQPATVRADVLDRGRALTLTGDPQTKLPACAECHGKTLTGVSPAMPALIGLPRDYIAAQLNAWRNGARRALEPDCMAEIAKRMSPDDVTAVSAWLASQPVPGEPRPAIGARLPMACGGIPGGESR